jgi:LPXTG-site transpeptidase (sortase) family protein
MTRKRYWLIFFCRFLGYTVLLSVPTWLGYSFYPVLSAEISYKIYGPREQMIPPEQAPEEVAEVNEATLPAETFADVARKPQPLPVKPVDREFAIVVPKIGANAQVVSDVNAANFDEYQEALKKGVAHAKGTSYPGQPGNSYLFAHSTRYAWDVPRYNAIFYLLHELEKDDRVTAFYRGKQYDYKVVKKVIAGAEDTSWFTAQYDEPVLTLQTCTPPGTTWKRLMVVAKLVGWE